MSAPTRDEIKSRRKLPQERLDAPEWGVSKDLPDSEGFFVRALMSSELDECEQACWEVDESGKKKMINPRAKWAARAVCYHDGARVFVNADADWLGRDCCVIIERIYEIATRLSGRSFEEQAKIEKNSEGSQKPDST